MLLLLAIRQGTAEYLTFAAVSKAVAGVVAYPTQVLRSRMQEKTGVVNVVEVAKFLWRFVFACTCCADVLPSTASCARCISCSDQSFLLDLTCHATLLVTGSRTRGFAGFFAGVGPYLIR